MFGRPNTAPPGAWRQRLIGVFATLAALALGLTMSVLVPDDAAVGVPARIVEAFAPLTLALALLFALTTITLGSRRLGSILALLAVAGGLWLGQRHLAMTTPLSPNATPSLRIVFFNIWHENHGQARSIADALLASDADVVIVAEAGPLVAELPRLRAAYPHHLGCAQRCDMLVLSRTAFAQARFHPLADTRERFAHMRWTSADGRQLTITGLHLHKPWFQGTAQRQRAQVRRQLRGVAGPHVVLGDFNATTWSTPIAAITGALDLRAARWPFATWPADWRPVGLPIDHVLLSDEVRLVRFEPFGDGLGSNHRGLLVDVALPLD